MASLHHLLMQYKGGTAGGKPYLVGDQLNLTPLQQGSHHTLSAALAARGPKHLTALQQQRRDIRSEYAKAAGLDPNVAFYGAHADPRAQALLKGGSGLGKGLGAAQADRRPEHHAEVDMQGLAQLLRAVGRMRRR